jgi:hypothetical protein
VATWFVMIPPGYASASDSEKQLVDLRVQYTDARTITAVEAGTIVSAARGYQDTGYGGQDLVKWKGPFATEADAQAAQAPTQQSPNPVADAVNAAENSTSGIGGLIAEIAKVWADVTNWKVWRSIGWLALGVVLILTAVAWWIGPGAAKALPPVIPL